MRRLRSEGRKGHEPVTSRVWDARVWKLVRMLGRCGPCDAHWLFVSLRGVEGWSYSFSRQVLAAAEHAGAVSYARGEWKTIEPRAARITG